MTQHTTRARDLTGIRFGRLVVIRRQEGPPGIARWQCLCDCGEVTSVRASHLRDGNVQSCGCLARERVSKAKRTHGMDRTKTYYAWASIKQRCRNPKNAMYHYYGARGIDICDRWHNSFEAFLRDMGEAPAGSSIDRINNDRGYEPGNCRWTTAMVQGNNKRNNVILEARGERHTLSEWARIAGIPKSTLHGRIKRGLRIEDAIARSS